jgi:hypothetical protein
VSIVLIFIPISATFDIKWLGLRISHICEICDVNILHWIIIKIYAMVHFVYCFRLSLAGHHQQTHAQPICFYLSGGNTKVVAYAGRRYRIWAGLFCRLKGT